MKDDSKKVITEINSTIKVPKDKTYRAIEEGIRLGKKRSRKRRVYSFIALATTAAIGMIIIINSPIANALTDIFGAKLMNVAPGETKEFAPKTINQTNNGFENIDTLKPIKLVDDVDISQELLMKYAWIPLTYSSSGELIVDVVDSKVVVHRFNATELLLSFVDVRTGQETSEADTIYYNDKNQPIEKYKDLDIFTYKLQDKILEQQVLFSSKKKSDPTYMELSIVDGLLVMFPHDDYSHKKERQLILQPVEIKLK
ncbi:hypothetical protein [Candidatus Enterococcus mansonii]|uniref:Uncharacterized protein n=1 Tax=Candidatus Enterococcus mansonii TaxID=1834181 RepID=A0A242CIF1_9ENTE|nr:hypothetical protein [Enterococcus sp. 4G2_DIV0659]OTO10006.1 hypothetical protein A5880_000689 [Enterococcus sp. 4G2_DIV0659]